MALVLDSGMGGLVMSICGYILCGFLALLAITIIALIWGVPGFWGKNNKGIDLSHLLNEANGQASMSRFQLLIFTFVIAISLFELAEKNPKMEFPDIPQGVLTLLGISASTYAVGKGISYSQPDLIKPKGTDGSSDEAKAAAGLAAVQASAAQQAADAAQAAVSLVAAHAATAQQAVMQSAQSAAVVQQAADAAQAAVDQIAGHVATVKMAVEQTAQSAAAAQQAADRAAGAGGAANGD